MRIVDDLLASGERFDNTALTIGSFDGVHVGHQAIIKRVVEAAKSEGATPALMTLDPHPRAFFSPGTAPDSLTTLEMKSRLAGEAGIELFLVLRFNEYVAEISREDFLRDIVVGTCGARRVIVGHDFRFGKGATGNADFLREAGPQYRLEVEEVPPLCLHEERVSSTRIRHLLQHWELDRANEMLGRPYCIVGEVVRGRGMGRQLGFPTANIDPHHTALPGNGIYACIAVVDGEAHMAAVNVGWAPTIEHQQVTVEAFLLDFEGDLVGKRIELSFHKWLRPELKFHSLDALIEAIGQDVETVRNHFTAEPV